MDGQERQSSCIPLSEELARRDELLRTQTANAAHYRKMYDRASTLARIGIWECDLATQELTWTDGVYDLFELPRGAPLDRDRIVALYEKASRAEMERLRAEAIRTCGSFALDIHIFTATGAERWLRLTADVEQEDGRAVRIFGTKQDITEERAAREKVRALQAQLIHVSRRSAMGAMATTLAHELNQPLAAISNYVAGMRATVARGASADEIIRGLTAIERCALGAGDIIRSVREMTGEGRARRRSIDPVPLIREAATLALMGSEAHAVIHYDLEEGMAVAADPIQLQQVFINLLRNAFDAVQDQSEAAIAITAVAAGDRIEIAVEDNGPGIAPDLLPRVFDSFVTTKPEGMGVGLSVSRTIVEAHGGTIAAENRSGGGATFRIALPATAEDAGD
jgi:two-component system sensor kinase FixL